MRVKCILHLPVVSLALTAGLLNAADPLPSWNDTAPKKAIIDFVEKVTKPDSPDFVPIPERIVTFDSDGTLWSEQPMLEWTTNGKGARLVMIIHHTDTEHEFAYNRESHVGKLDKGLDDASKRGWTVIDMKTDWKTIYPSDK